MKALRWILFSLLAFGLGTGIALVLHPPTIGIPTATASALAADLEKIRQYAGEGRCSPVKGRLNGAASKVDKLPPGTPDATVSAINDALGRVREQALEQCQRINDERIEREQREQEALEPTTPTTPEATTPSPTTPDSGDGAPDPGTDEGTTPITPDGPGNGNGPGGGNNGNGNGNGGGAVIPDDDGTGESTEGNGGPGGIGIPDEGALRQRLDDERRKWQDRADELRKAWEG